MMSLRRQVGETSCPEPLLAEDETMTIKSEMQALVDAWVEVYSAGDIDGALAFYSDDAAIYSPYGPAAIGIEALRATHAAWHASGETNKKVVVLNAESDGNLAYWLASYSGDYPQPDGTVLTECGVSVNVAKRQADGMWRFIVSSLNSDMPPLADATS